MFHFQYVTYKTKLKTNKYCLIAYIIHHWKVNFIKKWRGLCLIGIKRAFFPKEEVISTNKETVYMVVNFSFKKWYTSLLKNKTHCLLIFYVLLCNL